MFLPYKPVFATDFIITTIDACPYMCNHPEKKGYIVDILDEIFKRQGLQVEYQNTPWKRGIKLALNGKVDMVLAPTKAEAPSLKYPEQPIGVQHECFVTKKKNQWRYKQSLDLTAGKFVIPSGWGHENKMISEIGRSHYDQAFIFLNIIKIIIFGQ